LKAQLESLHLQLASLESREAIRRLHLAYLAFVESRQWQAVLELFDEQGEVQLYGATYRGKHEGLQDLYLEQYAQQRLATMHTAFILDQSQQQDRVELGTDASQASACFHCQVETSTPLQADSTQAQMARLQGMDESRNQEKGRFTVDYRQVDGQWRITRLVYHKV
jgi:hypothetical protein